MTNLGCLVRCHKRAKTLDIALSELERYGTLSDIKPWICIQADRPTPEVSAVLARHVGPQCHVCEAPRPAVADREYFLQNLNAHLTALEQFQPKLDWCYLADDDRWFEPQRITEELPKALTDSDIALWGAKSLFMWDRPNEYNAARHHDSPLFWRHIPKFRWTGKRMIQAPDALHDQYILTNRFGHLKTPLLDYGSFNVLDRAELYRSFTAAGKDDAYIQSLLEPPTLAVYPEDGSAWTDLYSSWQTDKTQSA